MKAFAWKSGQLGMGRNVSPDALLIAEGPPRCLRRVVGELAQVDADGWHYVPGFREAANDDAAGRALIDFLASAAKRLRDHGRSLHIGGNVVRVGGMREAGHVSAP